MWIKKIIEDPAQVFYSHFCRYFLKQKDKNTIRIVPNNGIKNARETDGFKRWLTAWIENVKIRPLVWKYGLAIILNLNDKTKQTTEKIRRFPKIIPKRPNV